MKRISLLFGLLASILSLQAADYSDFYKNLPVALQQPATVHIPDNTVRLTDFGAIGDGITLATDAFRQAFDKLEQMGGGRLIVPEGVWLTGPISMRSNTELHLDDNAIIMMSPDKRLFVNPKKPNSRCLSGITAENCENIAITGHGTIDGNNKGWGYAKKGKMSDEEWKILKESGGYITDDGKLWYAWKMANGLPDIAPTPQKQEKMRADLIRIYNCKRVLLKDITVQNSPRFHVHPYYCEDMIIDGIKVRCPWNRQNGDGIDLTDCHRVLLVNSSVDVGDDGICLKSDPPKSGLISGNEDFLIERCKVNHAHGGVVMGSNTSSGMRRIVARHCTFTRTDTGLRMKSGIGRGGRTEQVYFSDIMMADIAHEAVVVHCDYADMAPGDTKSNFLSPGYVESFSKEQRQWTPEFQDINISNIVCRGAKTAIKASGLTGLNCVHDIRLNNCTFVYTHTATDIHEPTAKLTLKDVTLTKE